MDRFFDDTWEIKRVNTLVNAKLTGVHKLDFRVPASGDLGITSPAYLDALDAFSQWARAQPKVAQVAGFDQVIKTIHRQMNNDQRSYYRIPRDAELNSQYLLLYELSLPYGADLEQRVNFDNSATRLTVVLHSASSSELLAFRQRAEHWIQEHWPKPLQTSAISLEAAFAQLNLDNSKSLLQGTFLGFVIIGILLCFTLGSLRLGVISLLSNCLPALAGFGVWGLVDGQIGLAVSIVAVITLGVVVDDTIHLLTKYQRARGNASPQEAARQALATTGKALFTTTLTLVICFGVLAFSHFTPNADLGFLSATVLALALVIDVFLLLPLVMLTDRRRPGAEAQTQAQPQS